MNYDFDASFAKLIPEEGGYVNDPNDPGGETKFGISKRAYPNIDIPNLTIDGAKAIYLEDYWRRCVCDALPSPINFSVFDTAVNSGVREAAKLLQETLGVPAEGIIGPGTREAIQGKDPIRLSVVFEAKRLVFMTTCSAWQNDGKGWARRVAGILEEIFND
jgi:lysozyme family protein